MFRFVLWKNCNLTTVISQSVHWSFINCSCFVVVEDPANLCARAHAHSTLFNQNNNSNQSVNNRLLYTIDYYNHSSYIAILLLTLLLLQSKNKAWIHWPLLVKVFKHIFIFEQVHKIRSLGLLNLNHDINHTTRYCYALPLSLKWSSKWCSIGSIIGW